MGKIYVKASPVSSQSAVTTYNYSIIDPQIGGVYDIGSVWTDPPGPYGGFLNNFLKPELTTAGTLTSGVLPAPVFAPQPGYIVSAWEPTLGWAEFILLRVPTATAVPVGTICNWDVTYAYVIAPTTANTGKQAAVSVASATVSSGNPVVDTTGGGLASNSTNVMYTWFLLTGRAWTLKTAVQVTPNAPVIVSGTAGRFLVTASAGKMWLGARAATSTTTSTQSAAIVYWTRSCMEGT